MRERISVSEKPGSTSIIVYPYRDKQKEMWLGIWLLGWLLGGLVMAGYFFIGSMEKEQRLFLLVWIAFWLYFLWLGSNAWFWRRKGFERILIKEGKLFYKKEISGRGKGRVFETEAIQNLRAEEPSDRSLIYHLSSSYWYVGGETITFDHFHKKVILGQQLSPGEQKKLLQAIEKAIQKS